MIVGEQMRLVGTIEGDEDLVVRGRVEGTVRIRGAVTVEPGGVLVAEVVARRVAVYGALHGNVTALEAIEIARTGVMVGDANAPSVAIVPGAAFRGRVEMALPAATPPAEAPPAPAVPAAAPSLAFAPPPPPVEAPPERRRLGRGPRAIPPLARPARGPLSRRDPDAPGDQRR